MTSVNHALENAVKRRFPVLASVPRLPAVVVGVATIVATTGAQAAVTMPDVSDVITAITGAVTIVSSIGVAVLSVVVTAKMFTWVRSAMK